MPSVFLSYARETEDDALTLEQGLKKHGITVWRDKTNLHSGERWPKALGEAIATTNFFLLLWSEPASTSDIVELEWTTALALKKPLLLWLLDEKPLPPSLTAIHGITWKDPAQVVLQIVSALNQRTPEPDQQNTNELLTRLGEISSTQPKEVLRQAKAVFEQTNWSVQGNVYQAKGDINITTASLPSAKPEKSKVEKSLAWVGLGVATLTLIGLLVDVPSKIMNLFSSPAKTQSRQGESASVPSRQEIPSSPINKRDIVEHPSRPIKTESSQSVVARPMSTVLSGLVFDQQTGEPIPGAQIAAPQLDLSVSTNAQGHFKLKVENPDSDRVLLVAQIDGYETFRTKATLGNTNLGFALRRLP